jgi:uncharacterized RmlC-like cupin family protein
MAREEAVSTDGMWAGYVTTEAGQTTAWHHHGDYESTIYVLDGTVRLDSGPGGAVSVEADAGDFIYVPPWAIHREANPSGEDPNHLIVFRAGSGPPVTNVDGPAD